MALSIALKKVHSEFLFRCKYLTGKIARRGNDSFCILMYHRIAKRNENNEYIQPGMYVEPDTFKMQLNILRSTFSIVSQSEMLRIIREGNSDRYEKPVCSITFDDGWRDFYENAFPILKSLNIAATVFLPTNFIGTHRWFWTDRLAFIWKHKKKNGVSSSDPIINTLSAIKGTFPSQIEKALAILKDLHLDTIEKILSQLENDWEVDAELRGRAFLNWQEVKEMHATGLISFGSHTAEHHILTTLNETVLRKELLNSKQRLKEEAVVDERQIIMCYPNGNYNERIARMVEDLGFVCATTTKTGWNHFPSELFALKRIGIHQDISSSNALFLSTINSSYQVGNK